MIKRSIAFLLCLAFITSYYPFVYGQDFSIDQLPVPGTMVTASAPFTPLALKGLIVDPRKPLDLQFIVDTGRGPRDIQSVKGQVAQLVKYFLAGLTIPQGDLWVNLSPFEKDRMVPEALGQTGLGRDLLAQDYILKQLTASLIYPEKELGREFWNKIYQKAQARFGTTNVPVDTLNKVWILPKLAQVYEKGNTVYVTRSTLKVMLDEDYLSLQKHSIVPNGTGSIGADITREIILPEIEKEVNTGRRFAPLRQIYQALILAKWYKESIQNGLLDAIYTNKKKVAGVDLKDPTIKEQIYQRYLQSYKKGVFNFIKDEAVPDGQVMPRKYFSGGTDLGHYELKKDGEMSDIKTDGAMLSVRVDLEKSQDHAMINVAEGIVDLVSELNNIFDLKPKIQGVDLHAYAHDPQGMVRFIQQYSILKDPEDIRRVLLWRLQSVKGFPLSGISAEKAQLLYNSVFDQEKLLASLASRQKPLNVVLFRKGSSQQLTNTLQTLPNLNIKIILSGTDDGLSWFYGAREFSATGISGAGRALLDLARDRDVARFLSWRIKGNEKDDVTLEKDFRGLVMKLREKGSIVSLSDEMQILYNNAMRMKVDKRQQIIMYLQSFMDLWDQERRDNPNTKFQFTLRGVPLRSLVLVGVGKEKQGDWQSAINEVGQLLDIAQGDEVILPTSERQHLIAVREDGTVYFSETAMNLYPRDSSFLGLWLVDQATYQNLFEQHSFNINGQSIPAKRVALGANSELQGTDREEVLETTKKVPPENAAAIAEYLSKVSTTSETAPHRVLLTPQAKKVLETADIILYSNDKNLETDVGGALIVPGVGQAIRSNQDAVKINLAEITAEQHHGDLADYLEREYRYLTGKMLFEHRRNDWADVESYVDYVLGGEVLGKKVQGVNVLDVEIPWLAKALIGLEQGTGNKVNAVTLNAHGKDFLSSTALLESLIALRGLHQAGFVVSNDGGLMPRSFARQQREHAPLGMFGRDRRVTEIIKEIRRNWPNIVNHGAFVFDVDQTILPKGSRGLDEFKELAYLFMRLLREDVKVAIISGNSQSQQMKRIYDAIRSEMKDDLSAFKNLVLYVNVGATKIEFKDGGREPVVDVSYGVAHSLDAKLMREAIDEVMMEIAHENFGLGEQEMPRFIEGIRKYLKNNYPGLKYTIPWAEGKPWQPEWILEDGLEGAVHDGRTVTAPWIEMRGVIGHEGMDHVASLAIKPTPEFEMDGKVYDVRQLIQHRIAEKLKLKGSDLGRFIFTSGGLTTTDITQVNARKTTALLDFISANSLDPQWVFYFGDEFYVDGKKQGNDEVIAREQKLAGVRTLAVNANSIKGAHEKTIWIGRSPQATMEFLEKVIDAAMTANGGIDLDRINVARNGRMIDVTFDQAQLDDIMQGGFEGFSPVIVDISPVQSPALLLGVSPVKEEV